MSFETSPSTMTMSAVLPGDLVDTICSLAVCRTLRTVRGSVRPVDAMRAGRCDTGRI